MFLGQTNNTQPAELVGKDRLNGFSSGGFSSYGDIYDSVYEDAKQNNSMFGLQNNFNDIFVKNQEKVFELTEQEIPGFETLRYKDIARSLNEDEELGTVEVQNYQLDLDQLNEQLKIIKETHPEIQTFEDMYSELKINASKTERRMQDILSRTDTTGSAVGFMSGLAGAFNSNDPLNILSLAAGGWGKTAGTKILTEMGIGGLAETINQFLGVKENRELLGLDNSAWRSAQQILFATAGAGIIRGGFEAAPPLFRAAERKVNPLRASGRELLKNIEEVGVPVRDENFVRGIAFEKFVRGRASPETRNVTDLADFLPDPAITGQTRVTASPQDRFIANSLEHEIQIKNYNALGKTPEGVSAHYVKTIDTLEEYRASIEAQSNGVEISRVSIFEDMPLRGVEETRGVDITEVNRILDEASSDIDFTIGTQQRRIESFEQTLVRELNETGEIKTEPLLEYVSITSPEKYRRLVEIDAEKANPNVTKGKLKLLAKEEKDIIESPEGLRAKEFRKADLKSNKQGIEYAKKQVAAERKKLRTLELKRKRIRDKADKTIDTTPRKILNPAETRVRNEGVKLTDAEPLFHVSGIGYREGLSPSAYVTKTYTTLKQSDAQLPQQTSEMLARIERSFDETDGKFDIGLPERVSGDLRVAFDDNTSITLKDMLSDLKEDDKLLAAIKGCAL